MRQKERTRSSKMMCVNDGGEHLVSDERQRTIHAKSSQKKEIEGVIWT